MYFGYMLSVLYIHVFHCIFWHFPSISHLPAASSNSSTRCCHMTPISQQFPCFPENRDILFCFSLRFSHVFSVLFYCILACACVFHVFWIHVVCVVYTCISLYFLAFSKYFPFASSQQQQQHQVLPHDPHQPAVSMFSRKPRHSFLF